MYIQNKNIYVYVDIYMCILRAICMHVYAYKYMCIFIVIYIHVYVYVYKCIYIYRYVHKYSHIYIYRYHPLRWQSPGCCRFSCQLRASSLPRPVLRLNVSQGPLGRVGCRSKGFPMLCTTYKNRCRLTYTYIYAHIDTEVCSDSRPVVWTIDIAFLLGLLLAVSSRVLVLGTLHAAGTCQDALGALNVNS